MLTAHIFETRLLLIADRHYPMAPGVEPAPRGWIKWRRNTARKQDSGLAFLLNIGDSGQQSLSIWVKGISEYLVLFGQFNDFPQVHDRNPV